jgi:hypothetical protein
MTDLTPEALDALQERLRRIEWGVTGEPCAAGNVDETAALEADTAITALRAQLAEREKACTEWAEVSQRNYQRAKAAEAQLATARPDAMREAAALVQQIARGYDKGGDKAIACGLYITSGSILALIDTPTPSTPSPEAVARAALEWQPIDTAPQDDGVLHVRALWVYSSSTKKPLYFEACAGVVSDGDFVSISGDDYGWRPEDYTHWMPLPEPPAAIIDKTREGGK